MHGSRFQKRHKQRNAHDDYNVTNDTAIIVGISFLYLCRTVKNRFWIFIFIQLCKFFPAFKPACLPFPHRAMAGKPAFRQYAVGGTPATVSHARMTMTVAGLPSRWQESTAFPFYCCAALCIFPWRVAPFIRPLFLFASPCMPTFPCRLQDGISVSFSLLGQR